MDARSLYEPIEHGNEVKELPKQRPLLTKGLFVLVLVGAVAMAVACATRGWNLGSVDAAPLRTILSGRAGIVELWSNWKWDGAWRDNDPHDLWHDDWKVMDKASVCKGPNGAKSVCMSPQCTQDDSYVLVGCVNGKCHHGVPDPKCKGVQNEHRYWHAEPLNEWCFGGRRDRKCPSPAITGERDDRWSEVEWNDMNNRMMALPADPNVSIVGAMDEAYENGWRFKGSPGRWRPPSWPEKECGRRRRHGWCPEDAAKARLWSCEAKKTWRGTSAPSCEKFRSGAARKVVVAMATSLALGLVLG